MKTLPQILKSWSLDQKVLTSPPIREKKMYQQTKQLLVRSMIRAEYLEAQDIIKISLNPENNAGKSNLERLEQMNITW